MSEHDAEARRGLLLGVAAYGFWGVVPLFWRLLDGVPALEVLAHRVSWGLVAFVGIAAAFGAGPDARRAMRDRRVVLTLLASGLLLAVNWGTFIYAVATDRLLHSSLGYFITPLFSVLLGTLALKERLRRLQWAAVLFATAGVVQLAAHAGGLPWIALVLAGSFSVYGLVRKTAAVPALAGSALETLFVAPFAASYLVYLAVTGRGAFGFADLRTTLLLVATGLITALPLVWFTAAARRLPLSTLGFLQYLSPTGQLILAVLVFREPFARRDAAAFACVLVGLALFSLDLWRSRARAR